jgi:hypothetical protein
MKKVVIISINYMGREGSTFINAFPVGMGEAEIFHFAFKKQFSRNSLFSE